MLADFENTTGEPVFDPITGEPVYTEVHETCYLRRTITFSISSSIDLLTSSSSPFDFP